MSPDDPDYEQQQQERQQQQPTAASPYGAAPSKEQVGADYQQYLGRSLGDDEYNNYWSQQHFNDVGGYNYNGANDVGGSAEGRAYASRSQDAPAPPPSASPEAPSSGGGGESGGGGGGAPASVVSSYQSTPSSNAAPAGTPGVTPGSAWNMPGSLAQPTMGAKDPRSSQLYDELMKRSQQGLTVNANDPHIKAQTDAASVAGNREMLHSQQAAAERGGAYNTGGQANFARASAEHLGNNMANLTGQLLGREVDARRKEISDALSGRQGMLSQEESSRLREQDQRLQGRAQDLGWQQNQSANQEAMTQNAWMRQYQQQGFTADQAQRAWQNKFNTDQQRMNQGNAVWEQNNTNFGR
jgi:hypothetical protein